MVRRSSTSHKSVSRDSSTRRTDPFQSPSFATSAAAAAAPSSGDQDSEVYNPTLPDVRTQQSFAYGSTKTPLLPRQLEVDPSMGLAEMADTLDSGLRHAQERDLDTIEEEEIPEPQMLTRSKRRSMTRGLSAGARSVTGSISPAPRAAPPPPTTRRLPRSRSRQMTPDEQLLESLREASEEGESAPPSPAPGNSTVEDSSLSWIIERNVNPTIQNPYSNARPAGSRRSSSVAAVEQVGERSPTSSRAQSVPAQTLPVQGPLQRPVLDSAVRKSASEVTEQIRDAGVAAKQSLSTAINTIADTSAQFSSTTRPTAFHEGRRTGWTKSLLYCLTMFLGFLAGFGIYACRDQLMAVPLALRDSLSAYRYRPTPFPVDSSSGYTEAFTRLSSSVDKRLADMAKDVASLKKEWDRRLPHLQQFMHPTDDPLYPPKLNFFSEGSGARIDPTLTSPTKVWTKRLDFWKRWKLHVSGVPRHRSAQVALQDWKESGDCWCAAQTEEGMSQMGVLLGRPIVPEEVVIEHVPRTATLDPMSAPRHMELWAEFIDRTPQSKSSPSKASPSPSVTLASLRATILSTLHIQYPSEDPAAYSDDPHLGPNFYRVGKWEYNINAKNHIQKFDLGAVFDLPEAKVSKVVVRTTGGWGAQHTCLYRVRLHGHI